MAWLASPRTCWRSLAATAFACVVNLSDSAVALPAHSEIILSSGPLEDGLLGVDTAVWLRTA